MVLGEAMLLALTVPSEPRAMREVGLADRANPQEQGFGTPRTTVAHTGGCFSRGPAIPMGRARRGSAIAPSAKRAPSSPFVALVCHDGKHAAIEEVAAAL